MGASARRARLVASFRFGGLNAAYHARVDEAAKGALEIVEEQGVRFVRLWFTDVLGFLKSFAIPAPELAKAFEEGIGFDGSAVEGFARVEEADMLAKPDPLTFKLLPWRRGGEPVARVLCDVLHPDGSPFAGDPRYVLRRALARAADQGFGFEAGPEVEFFLSRSTTELAKQSEARMRTSRMSTPKKGR